MGAGITISCMKGDRTGHVVCCAQYEMNMWEPLVEMTEQSVNQVWGLLKLRCCVVQLRVSHNP